MDVDFSLTPLPICFSLRLLACRPPISMQMYINELLSLRAMPSQTLNPKP